MGHPELAVVRLHVGQPAADALAVGFVVGAEGAAQDGLLVEENEEAGGEQEEADVGEKEERPSKTNLLVNSSRRDSVSLAFW
jgi:hypothetical protein